ncbi:MAG: ABC transporter substrate-binding protein [Acidobacteria bacterium]|nr:ABC transporter substrate-binding protein [Acidobacteriota bacterium]
MSGARRIFCPGLKREVTLPGRVSRAVSLAPSLTDTVHRLGLGGALVGRSASCHRPPEVSGLPVVGSYTSVTRSRLDALDPDLILMISGAQEELAGRLADEGFPVYQFPLPASPWGILENLATVATVMGSPGAAGGPLGELHAALLAVHDRLPALGTYAEIDLGGPVTIGPGSYVYWALRWLGLDVLTPGVAKAYFTPDDASLARMAPDLIVYDPKPGGAVPLGRVEDHLKARGLGGWFRAGARLVVTGGDVLAHSGPWLIEYGLPWLVGRILAADGDRASI